LEYITIIVLFWTHFVRKSNKTDLKLLGVRNLNIWIILGFLAVVAISFVTPAFGHGMGGETLPPVTVGNRNATLFLNVNPPVFDPNDNEQQISVRFYDSQTEAVIEHVTYLIEVSKDNKMIFRYMFHDEFGNLYMKIISKNTDGIKIDGNRESLIGGWMKKDDLSPLTLEGPIFMSGGLYNFHIEIVTVDSDDKLLDERIIYDAGISVAEKTSHEIMFENGKKYQIGLTSYYDQIENFQFVPEQRVVTFTMPFDWSQKTIDQVGVVHEEIHVPKTFVEMLVTKYDATVNGIPLAESSVTIDDYSEDGRIVHLVLNKDSLFSIHEAASKISSSQMQFSMTPSKEEKFPLTAFTRNAQYKVGLSWEPSPIKAGETTRFFIDIIEPYTPKIPGSTTYDFVLKQNDKEILRKTSSGQINAPTKTNFQDYVFAPENIGPIIVLIENMNGNNLATVDFVTVVKPADEDKPKFPIRILSNMEDGSGDIRDGGYNVDITWVPAKIGIDEESEFIITIYDKETGLPVPQAEYDFVLLQNSQEVYRKSGVAQAGGSFENYKFSKNQVGQITIRIDNINNSGEFAEIPISVTPEFPFSSLIVLSVIFTAVIALSKLRNELHA